MRFLILLATLAVAANGLSSQEQWTQFKLDHSKEYQNLREEQVRFLVFSDNLRKIEEHNARYEKGEVSYYLAVNQFADMTPEEFKSMVDSQMDSMPRPNITSRFVPDPLQSAPSSIDWRDNGAILSVRDQGNCGGCWAFSAAAALEGQNYIKNKKSEQLSVQQLIDCSSSYQNQGCNGGLMDFAFSYVKDHGICLDPSYKYKAQDGTCHTCSAAINTISGHKSVDPNESALKEAVGTVGPVSVGVNANLEWQLYGGGIFDHALCLGLTLNHGVLAAGYGEAMGKDYWLIKNSWGTTWGENGYIRLVRGKNQCGITKMASYPVL